MIVDESSLLQLASRSFIHLVACRMSLGAVPSAELLGEGIAAVAMVAQGAFIPQYAPLVVSKLQCRLNLQRDDQSTAKSAMRK